MAGDARSQGIISHGIDLFLPKHSGLSASRFSFFMCKQVRLCVQVCTPQTPVAFVRFIWYLPSSLTQPPALVGVFFFSAPPLKQLTI